MKKLKRLSLANAVMAGGSEQIYLQAPDYDLTLRDGVVIDIVNNRNKLKTQTSLFNAKWWEESDEQPEPQKRGPGKPKSES